MPCDRKELRWLHGAELALALGSDEKRRTRQSKRTGKAEQVDKLECDVPEEGQQRIMSASCAKAGIWKAGKAWPGDLDFTQQTARRHIFQAFEQGRGIMETNQRSRDLGIMGF